MMYLIYVALAIAIAAIIPDVTHAEDIQRGDISLAVQQAFEQQAELVAKIEAAYQSETDSDSTDTQTNSQE